jgi:hypothetical protein
VVGLNVGGKVVGLEVVGSKEGATVGVGANVTGLPVGAIGESDCGTG